MRSFVIFFILGLTLVLSAIGTTSVAVAFPSVISSFHISLILAGWIISIYQLGLTGVMPIAGRVGDILGKKFTFLLCLFLFTLGSALCAVSPNAGLLIFSRFIQSLGGGGFMPAAVGILADEFPKSKHRAIGFLSSIFPIGMIIGPNLGGLLVEQFGWRSVFWINVPACLVLMAPAFLVLRREERKNEAIDLPGTVILFVSLFSLMAGLSLIGSKRSAGMFLAAAVLVCLSVALMVVLIKFEKRATYPVIDVEVLRGRPFMAANIYNFMYGATIIGSMSLIPAYAVFVYGMGTLQSGVIVTPRSAAMIAFSSLTSFYIMRWGYRWPIVAGTLSAAAGLLLLGFRFDSVSVLYVINAVVGIGTGLAAPASNNACIELMPERAATITGIRGMFRQTGGALSVAVATVVLHVTGNMFVGFRIIFFGMTAAFLAALPAVFLMPGSPKAARTGMDAAAGE
ncbi:MAG TPA: MFS transporter [Chitinivibrionales bacterium]|nr:MFS transporter [Chitinivibrionales bacterium]